MDEPTTSPPGPAGDNRRFETTHWSVVLTAAESASPRSRAAFGTLYQSYSQALYDYVRRKGHSPDDSKDLLHDFFEALLAKNYLQSVVRERGRFRGFLLGSLRHFLANDWHRNHRLKRGGPTTTLSLEQLQEDAERRFQITASETVSPETLFDRAWAHALLARVIQSLRAEWNDSGRGGEFATLRVFLDRPGDAASYAEAGRVLGLAEGAVKVAVHRLRLRFRKQLHSEVARTVGPAGDVEDELRHLINVLRNDLQASPAAGLAGPL